jgi:hypothetical protein
MADYEREGHARPGSPRSTLTVRGGWTRRKTGSRCRCMARASECSTLTPPEYKIPTEDWITDTAMQRGEAQGADREGEVWIGYSASGTNHETSPVSSSKCHGRITLFRQRKVSLASIRPSRWYCQQGRVERIREGASCQRMHRARREPVDGIT